MRQELNNLSQEFLRYRGRKKRVKYPTTLWDKAIKLAKHLSLDFLQKSKFLRQLIVINSTNAIERLLNQVPLDDDHLLNR